MEKSTNPRHLWRKGFKISDTTSENSSKLSKYGNKKNNQKALVLLSGGQDSTTCLVWAKQKFDQVHAITFDYGQRHRIELKSAKKIAKITQIPLKVVKIDLFKTLTSNALTNHSLNITSGLRYPCDKKTTGKAQNREASEKEAANNIFPQTSINQLPSTFVPGRNLLFISIAGIHATQLNITNIVIGVCQTDYSGYPDCRNEFIKSLEKTLSLAINHPFKIHTPLMWLTKKETIELMQKSGQLELLKYSHTCYKGLRPACGHCPSCKLRLKGFEEAGVKDPIKYN